MPESCTHETWTQEKDTLRKQLNREYAKLRRDKTRVRKFSPKPKLSSSLSEPKNCDIEQQEKRQNV
jgi:hypothetical protein